MQQTLFYIPHFLFEGPLLWGWLIVGALFLAIQVWKHGVGNEAFGFLPVFVVGALVIYFVLPSLEVTDISADDPEGPQVKVGLAVRGYGLMLLLGLIAGVGMSIYRARFEGIQPDRMISFAFWLVISGIVGARLFYVIQKREQFDAETPLELLGSMVNMTQGGLVVYGSIIGAMLGGTVYLWRAKLPILKIADIIAPGMAMGLAIGRVGCLMNGCCFGGTCDIPQIAQRFPAGSPPYLRQLETGQLLGINTRLDPSDNNRKMIAESIESGSVAEKYGVVAEKPFAVQFPNDKVFRAIKQRNLDLSAQVLVFSGEREIPIPIAELSNRSMPVFPAQLLSAINAALLSALLWFYYPFRKNDGQVFALMLVSYSITRFLLEYVRRDELGEYFGFTISQLVSMMTVVVGFAMFASLNSAIAKRS